MPPTPWTRGSLKRCPFFQGALWQRCKYNTYLSLKSKRGVDEAREKIAMLISETPKEIVFTSGATENNNPAWEGVFKQHTGYRKKKKGLSHT